MSKFKKRGFIMSKKVFIGVGHGGRSKLRLYDRKRI